MYIRTEKKIKLLLVEDDKLYRDVLRDTLNENICCEVIGEAEDGQKGVELANKLRPDVILMDLGIPVLNGIEATRKIHESNPEIKIIILTSHSTEKEAMEALNAGAESYVRKDINLQHLSMIIHTVNQGGIWMDPVIGHKVLEYSLAGYTGKHK